MKETTKKMLIEIGKEVAKAICIAVLTALGVTMTSCSTTRASITQPHEGSSTTITITTNNPQSINADPTTNFDFLNKK